MLSVWKKNSRMYVLNFGKEFIMSLAPIHFWVVIKHCKRYGILLYSAFIGHFCGCFLTAPT